jgi:preprotein translocase, secE subunit
MKEKKVTAETEEKVEKSAPVKAEKEKPAKKANKKPNIFKRMGRALKEGFMEIKKVTWPSFGKVVRQTGVVLAVCLFFLVVLAAMDLGLGELMKLLTSI